MWENEAIDPILRAWRRSRGEPEDGPQEGGEDEGEGAEGAEAAEAAAAAAEGAGEQADASGDVEMQ